MRKISVIGSGPAGCVFAYALMNEGYDVTMYSDRTPEDWLDRSAPTGTAYLFGSTIDIERELGMDYWSHAMFEGHGVLLDFCPKVGMPSLKASGLFEHGKAGCGIDMRMRVHRWLSDFEERGGKLVIEAVSATRLDEIAQASDLTVLAAGKGEVGRVIPRDAKRSVYDKPQRNLAMTFTKSKSGGDLSQWFRDRVDFNPVKFDFFAEEGEFFWVPYVHKDEGPVYCILWEAKPGRAIDRFDGVKSGADILERGKSVIKDLCPWERHLLDDMAPVDDPHGWVAGRFAPTVRHAFGELPSGAKVIPVGDTAVTFDPIGGQGGNHAAKHAKWLADQVIARGDAAFDARWMTETFDGWWNAYAKYAYAFNNTLLEPLTPAGKALMMEVARNETFASERFFSGFPNPKAAFPTMEDLSVARKAVREYRRPGKRNGVHKQPAWLRLIDAQVALTSAFGRQNYPSPGHETSVTEGA